MDTTQEFDNKQAEKQSKGHKSGDEHDHGAHSQQVPVKRESAEPSKTVVSTKKSASKLTQRRIPRPKNRRRSRKTFGRNAVLNTRHPLKPAASILANAPLGNSNANNDSNNLHENSNDTKKTVPKPKLISNKNQESPSESKMSEEGIVTYSKGTSPIINLVNTDENKPKVVKSANNLITNYAKRNGLKKILKKKRLQSQSSSDKIQLSPTPHPTRVKNLTMLSGFKNNMIVQDKVIKDLEKSHQNQILISTEPPEQFVAQNDINEDKIIEVDASNVVASTAHRNLGQDDLTEKELLRYLMGPNSGGFGARIEPLSKKIKRRKVLSGRNNPTVSNIHTQSGATPDVDANNGIINDNAGALNTNLSNKRSNKHEIRTPHENSLHKNVVKKQVQHKHKTYEGNDKPEASKISKTHVSLGIRSGDPNSLTEEDPVFRQALFVKSSSSGRDSSSINMEEHHSEKREPLYNVGKSGKLAADHPTGHKIRSSGKARNLINSKTPQKYNQKTSSVTVPLKQEKSQQVSLVIGSDLESKESNGKPNGKGTLKMQH